MTSSTISTSDIEEGSIATFSSESSSLSSSPHNGRSWVAINMGMGAGCCLAGYAWNCSLCSLGLLSLAAGIYALVEGNYLVATPCFTIASTCCVLATNCLLCHSITSLSCTNCAVTQLSQS